MKIQSLLLGRLMTLGLGLFFGASANAQALFTQGGRPGNNQGAYISWNQLTGGAGETSFINSRGYGVGGFAFFNTSTSGNGNLLAFLRGDGMLGIGTSNPRVGLDIAGGPNPTLHVAGAPGLSTYVQGAYINWNGLTGAAGETDFVNNRGLGTGGFAFFNGDSEGRVSAALMYIRGDGYVGIQNQNPNVALDVNGGIRAGSEAAVSRCGMGAESGEGTQRYNYSSHAMEYCNGSGWMALAATTGDSSPLGTLCGFTNADGRGYYTVCKGYNVYYGCPAGYFRLKLEGSGSGYTQKDNEYVSVTTPIGYTCSKL